MSAANRLREQFGWQNAPQSKPMRRLRMLYGNYLETVACGRPFIVDLRDTIVSPGILYYGVWEPEKSELFNRLLKLGDRVVDVGANIGYFTVLFAAAVGSAGEVLAIEPDPDNVKLLTENVGMNRLAAAVTILQAAAGPRAGELGLYARRGVANRGDHRTFSDGASDCRRTTVAMVAVDDCVKDWPSVQTIKMDIQGYEHSALWGMQRTLAGNDDIALVTEYWPSEMRRAGSDPSEFLGELRKLGFSGWRIQSGGSLTPIDAGQLVRELEADSASADLLFMRPDFAPRRLGTLLN